MKLSKEKIEKLKVFLKLLAFVFIELLLYLFVIIGILTYGFDIESLTRGQLYTIVISYTFVFGSLSVTTLMWWANKD